MEATRRRPGRPRIRPGDDAGAHVGFRAPRGLKRRLEDAAKVTGRSLSTEAQFRLEQSFRDGDILDQAITFAFGEDGAGLLRLMADIMVVGPGACGFSRESNWLSDPVARSMTARMMIRGLVRLLKPDFELSFGSYAPEERADAILWELTERGREPVQANRIALEKRYGRTIAEILADILEADKSALQTGPAREIPNADPVDQAKWDIARRRALGEREKTE